jgi:hypothetical protein
MMTDAEIKAQVDKIVKERQQAERERAEKLAQVRLRGEVEASLKRLERQEAEAAKVAAFQRKQVAQLKADERARWVGDDKSFDAWWQQGGEVATLAKHAAETEFKGQQANRLVYAEF